MARSPYKHDKRGRGVAAALAVLLAFGWAMPLLTPAANLTGDLIVEDSHNVRLSPDGVSTADDVVFTHGGNTRITATHARLSKRPGDSSKLDLWGKVHIEFSDALLDADSAVLDFHGKDLLSVTVKGSQAQFSHQPKGYARRVNGRADEIEFVSATGKVTFSGNGFYTDGRGSWNSDVVVYDINNGTVGDDGDPTTRGRGVWPLGESADRVPPPRQPDRSTAK